MACRLDGTTPLSENRHSNIFVEKNTFENVVCEMLSISFIRLMRFWRISISWIQNYEWLLFVAIDSPPYARHQRNYNPPSPPTHPPPIKKGQYYVQCFHVRASPCKHPCHTLYFKTKVFLYHKLHYDANVLQSKLRWATGTAVNITVNGEVS